MTSGLEKESTFRGKNVQPQICTSKRQLMFYYLIDGFVQVGSMETIRGINELMLSFLMACFSTLDNEQKEKLPS